MSDSREQFEAWVVKHCAPLCKGAEAIRRTSRGDYVEYVTQENWEAWQASRAQPERKLTDAEIFAGLQCVIIAADQEYTRCKGVIPDWDLGFFSGQLHVFERYLNADKKSIAEAKEYISKLQTAASQPAVPEGWRKRLYDMRDADYTYSQHPELARVVFDSVIDALQELEDSTTQPAAATVPDGWKLVPDAQNMTEDQAEAIAGTASCCGGIAYDIYRAALEASPQPPAAQPQDGGGYEQGN